MGKQLKKLKLAACKFADKQPHLMTASVTGIKEGDQLVACVLIQRKVLPGTPLTEEAINTDAVAEEWYKTGERPDFARDWFIVKLPPISDNSKILESISQEPLAPNAIRSKLYVYEGYDFFLEYTPAEKNPEGKWESLALGRIHLGSGVGFNSRRRIGTGATPVQAEQKAKVLAREATLDEIDMLVRRRERKNGL